MVGYWEIEVPSFARFVFDLRIVSVSIRGAFEEPEVNWVRPLILFAVGVDIVGIEAAESQAFVEFGTDWRPFLCDKNKIAYECK